MLAMCHLCYCWNIGTSHIEGATYTIITVPYKNDLLSAYCFWIQTNHSHIIVLDMNKEIVFMLSLGLLLKHRQKCNSRVAADFCFFYFASYGNSRLFTHLWKSWKREICDESLISYLNKSIFYVHFFFSIIKIKVVYQSIYCRCSPLPSPLWYFL